MNVFTGRKPNRYILTTSTTAEVSLADAKTVDGKDIDLRFENGVRAIEVKLRKPIDNSNNQVPTDQYVLYVANQPNQMRNPSISSYDYHNRGIFDTVGGNESWVEIDDFDFTSRPNKGADGFNKYNYWFACRKESWTERVSTTRPTNPTDPTISTTTYHQTSRWFAATLEILIYPAR